MKTQTKLSGACEQNQLLGKVTQGATKTIGEYERTINELQSAVKSLSEENQLLRDFAYNVDPNARVLHSRMFKGKHSRKASYTHSNASR